MFGVSDCVLTYSDNYCFRFDKSNHFWKDKPNEYPCQIIPIWTELHEIPAEVVKYLDKKNVNFVLKFRDLEQRDNLCKALKTYCENPKNLLLLEKINNINFKDIPNHYNLSIAKEEIKETKEFDIKKIVTEFKKTEFLSGVKISKKTKSY